MQIALESGFAADRLWLAVSDDRARIAAMGGVMHPGAGMRTELRAQEFGRGGGEFADGVDAQRFEFRTRLRADAVDLARRQRPDACGYVFGAHQGQAVGLVEIGRDLGQQLVGRDPDRTTEARGCAHRRLEFGRERARRGPVVAGLHARAFEHEVGQVEIDFVDAAVFDQGRDRTHRLFEQARIFAVFVEIGRQQDRFGRQRRRFHEPHARMHAQGARRVGGCGDDAAPRITVQARVLARACAGGGVKHLARLMAPPAADDHRLPGQVGVAQ